MSEAVVIDTPASIPVHRREEYDWFIEPLGEYTNEYVANYLAKALQGEEATRVEMFDRRGRPHDVWQVPYRVVGQLHESRRTNSNLKFLVFHRKTGSGCSLTEFQFTKPADTVVKHAIRTQQERRGGRRF